MNIVVRSAVMGWWVSHMAEFHLKPSPDWAAELGGLHWISPFNPEIFDVWA